MRVPARIRAAEAVKIAGQSRNGRNLILNPVNNDTTAKATSATAAATDAAWAASARRSTAVTRITNAPRNTRNAPSAIHSMVMIWRLSSLIGPNPAVTFRVGRRCATPHAAAVAPPTYNITAFTGDLHPPLLGP